MATSTAKLKPAPAPSAPEPEVEADAQAPLKPTGKKRLIMMLSLLLVLAAAGGTGGWYWWSSRDAGGNAGGEAAEAPNPVRASTKPPQFVPLEQFTVNLQDDTVEHFLQVAVILEVADGDAADAVKRYLPIIRNRILLLLSSKRARELASVEGKQALAAEIASEAREPLPPGRDGSESKGVENVHFASFVIQ